MGFHGLFCQETQVSLLFSVQDAVFWKSRFLSGKDDLVTKLFYR